MKGRSVVLAPLSHETANTTLGGNNSPQRQMTLEVKAKTLGYQLPHAESEIQRIQELQRAKRDEFMKLRSKDRSVERSTQVAHWLERHSEQSLQELNLAMSEVPVRDILIPNTSATTNDAATPTPNLAGGARGMEELFSGIPDAADVRRGSVTGSFRKQQRDDGLGLSRYQVRGDLKEWLSRVEALNERLILDGGDFTPNEEAYLKNALEHQISKAVHRDAARDDNAVREAVKTLCELMEGMTRTPFAVREDLPARQQVDAFTRQVQDLYSTAMKRGGFVLGSQVALDGSSANGVGSVKKTESEGEIRKRQIAAGVAAAAQSQHILLTHAQLDQVLQAFYQQQRPSNKREQARLERQVVQGLMREDNITSSLRRRNTELTKEVESLQGTVQELVEERRRARKQSSLVPVPLSEGSSPESLQQANETIREMAEVLARKAMRDVQGQCEELRHERDTVVAELTLVKDEFNNADREREELQKRVNALEVQWAEHEEAKRQQEAERNRLFGGMRSDQQYYQSTIHKVLMQSSATMSTLVMHISEADRDGKAINWGAVDRTMDDWTQSVSFAFHFCEAAKAITTDLRKTIKDAARSSSTATPTQAAPLVLTSVDDINRQLVNDLSQRLDETIAEAKSKFREARYMRGFLWYLIHCFEAMLNGTYSDEIHGKRRFHNAGDKTSRRGADSNRRKSKRGDDADGDAQGDDPFPPASIVALDNDYAYAWSEEAHALERVFLGLRSRLSTSESQQGEVNKAVLRALESVGDPPSKVAQVFSPTGITGEVPMVASASPPTRASHTSIEAPAEVRQLVSQISSLDTVNAKDVRLTQALEDHQRLPSGARAVDVATVLLLQIKEAKGHFSGGDQSTRVRPS